MADGHQQARVVGVRGHDLVGNVGAMSAASGRANVVDEADLLERARVGEADADLPARVDLLVEFHF